MMLNNEYEKKRRQNGQSGENDFGTDFQPNKKILFPISYVHGLKQYELIKYSESYKYKSLAIFCFDIFTIATSHWIAFAFAVVDVVRNLFSVDLEKIEKSRERKRLLSLRKVQWS